MSGLGSIHKHMWCGVVVITCELVPAPTIWMSVILLMRSLAGTALPVDPRNHKSGAFLTVPNRKWTWTCICQIGTSRQVREKIYMQRNKKKSAFVL